MKTRISELVTVLLCKYDYCTKRKAVNYLKNYFNNSYSDFEKAWEIAFK